MSKETLTAHASEPQAVRYFGDSRCRSIWQWQLILAFAAVTIAVGVALLTPTMFADWRFSSGLFMIVVITIGSLAVPWHQINTSIVVALPLLDTVAIGVLNSASSSLATFMWVFPVAWVASYYSTSMLISTLASIAVFRLFNAVETGFTPEAIIRMLVLLLTLGFVGVIMSVGTQRNRSTRRLLQAQSARLTIALHRVNEQKTDKRRLIDSLDIGVARATRGDVIDVSNRAFREIYALTESSQFRPTGAVEYYSRRGRPVPHAETTIARASRGELFTDAPVWLFGIDGRWRALKTSTRHIEDSDSADSGVVLIVEDVSTKVDLRMGEEATRRNLSHELRNPLTAILGHVDLLLERQDIREDGRRQLEVIERAGSRMQRLIDDALATSPHLHEDADRDFDVADIARASIEGFAPVAEAEGVTLKVRMDDTLPTHGDSFRLRQVVDNVIGNAIKYAQSGGTVSIDSIRRSDQELALVVTDTGIGISAEDLPHVFEPEFRTQLARERGIQGTGLGLGISRDIVREQGGCLEIKSELGHGTEVTLVVPSLRELNGT